MKRLRRYLAPIIGVTLSLIGLSGSAQAGLIIGNGPLGDFTGSLDLTIQSSMKATLTITLTNTSQGANGGYLTAFVLNNPGKGIERITLDTAPKDFDLLGSGSPASQNGVKAEPYGLFDFGASTGGSFLGGGKPSKGLAPGVTGEFVFGLTGTGLNILSLADFTTVLTDGLSKGKDKGTEFFVARFKGFQDKGSDKVPGTLTAVPEPSTLVSCSIAGAIGLGFTWCRRRQTTAAV